MTRVAVASRSFSANPVLRDELARVFDGPTFNDDGRKLVGEELVVFLRGHTHVIIGLEKVDAGLLASLPELQVVSKYGVGLDSIDLPALERFGVRLGWTAGVNRRSVAELALGFALTMLHRAYEGGILIRGGGWQQLRGGLLSGRTVGIVGCGNIGSELAALLAPFECRVLANDIRELKEERARLGIEQVSLDELLGSSDVVSLHVPLTERTRRMLDEDKLCLIKRGAILLNTARGGLVDEAAVERLLQVGHLAGAAFDVFEVEPPTAASLLALPTFFPTPHIGGSTEEAVLAMGRAAIEGLRSPRPAAEVMAELAERT